MHRTGVGNFNSSRAAVPALALKDAGLDFIRRKLFDVFLFWWCDVRVSWFFFYTVGMSGAHINWTSILNLEARTKAR